MSRYIDRDKLLDDLNWIAPGDEIRIIIKAITKQPEADVVKVIRCKDCKYYGQFSCTNARIQHLCNENDYCSYAERKG